MRGGGYIVFGAAEHDCVHPIWVESGVFVLDVRERGDKVEEVIVACRTMRMIWRNSLKNILQRRITKSFNPLLRRGASNVKCLQHVLVETILHFDGKRRNHRNSPRLQNSPRKQPFGTLGNYMRINR